MSDAAHFEEPVIPYPPRFWWLKRIVLFSILLIIACAGLLKWWGYESHRRLQAEIDAIHARGEPILVEDYKTKLVLDASNAAISLIAAQNAIALTRPQEIYTNDLTPSSTIDAAGMTMLEQINLATTTTRQLARQARFQPQADWGARMVSPTINVMLPSLNSQRLLTNLLNVNVIYEHVANHDAEAVEVLRDMLRQSEALEHHSPTLVGHLVAIAVSTITCETTRQISFNLDILKDAGATTSPSSAASRQQVLALIGEFLDDRAYRQGLVNAMHGERTFQYDASTTQLSRVAANRFTGLSPLISQLGFLQPMFELDAIRMIRNMDSVIAASSQQNYFAAKAHLPNENSFSKAGLTPLSILPRILGITLTPSLHRVVETHYRGLTERRAAALHLAIRLYQLDHDGKLPTTFSDLVPAYLPAIPIDPYSPNSEPMKYRASPAPMIYSVGLDGKDDGGDASLPPSAPGWAHASSKPAGYPGDGAKWQRLDIIYPLTKPPPSPPPATNEN